MRSAKQSPVQTRQSVPVANRTSPRRATNQTGAWKGFWRRCKSVLTGWDAFASLVPVLFGAWLLPDVIKNSVAAGFYSSGMAILAIMFSVYFAALAIILSASGDDFVRWMERNRSYSELIWSFKFTLVVLFISLIAAVTGYSCTAFSPASGEQSRWCLIAFGWIATYALFATFYATMDAAKYCQNRAEYLRITGPNGDRQSDKSDSTAGVNRLSV